MFLTLLFFQFQNLFKYQLLNLLISVLYNSFILHPLVSIDQSINQSDQIGT